MVPQLYLKKKKRKNSGFLFANNLRKISSDIKNGEKILTFFFAMFPFDPPFDVFRGSEGNIVKKRVNVVILTLNMK